MRAKVLLSTEGASALGTIFRLGRRKARAVRGSVLGYLNEGVWFQDNRLLRSGEMVLIKWHFVEAILSEVAIPQPLQPKSIGFVAGTTE